MDPHADRRWETFVAGHPQATVYHHPAWMRVLNNEYDQPSVHLACVSRDGRVRGVLPLLHTRGVPLLRGPLTSRRLSSLPRTPVAGPLADGSATTAALLREAVARTRQEPGLLLQVKVREPLLDDAAAGLEASPWRNTYVIELPDDPGSVRFGDSRNHTRIRSGVRKARALGCFVKPAETLDEVRAWYRLYLDTMRAHVVPPRPLRLFEAMWDVLLDRGMMRLLLAYKAEATRPALVAGSLFLTFGDTIFYAFNGRAREQLWMRPNDLIQWEAVHQAAAEGFRYYDLGEVTARNEGLAQFKKKWAADARQLHRYHYPPVPRRDHAQGDDGRGRKMAEAAWRRLPYPVTAGLGHQVYRYL